MNTPKERAEALKALDEIIEAREACIGEVVNMFPLPKEFQKFLTLVAAFPFKDVRTALSAQAGWRPISEASKHEHILAFGRDGVHIAKWSSMGNKWRGVNLSHSIPQPTHFMPLPSPPAEGK